MSERFPDLLDTAPSWQRKFQRRAIALAWMGIPVALCGFVPAIKPFSSWFLLLATLLSAPWFLIVFTGFAGGPATKPPELRFAPPRILIQIAFPAIFLIGGVGAHAKLSPDERFAVFLFDGIVIAIGAIGTLAMCGCYAIWLFFGKYNLATSWLRFGITLVAWAVVLLPAAVVFLEKEAN